MSFVRFFLSRAQIKTIDTIQFDCFISETHKRSGRSTKYPVEFGADISDHYQPDPIRLQITGTVSNSSAYTIDLNPFRNPAIASDTWQKINLLMERRTPFIVVTGLKVYFNMVIANITHQRDKSTGNEFRFIASLEQIITVPTQLTQIPASSIGGTDLTEKAAQPLVDAGDTVSGQSQQTIEPGYIESKEAEIESIVNGIFEGQE